MKIINSQSPAANLQSEWFDGLVNPLTGKPLYHLDGSLICSTTGRRFSVHDEIAQLLVPELGDRELFDEIKAMDNNPVAGNSYFKDWFTEATAAELYGLLGGESASFNIIEIGGGEGHLARKFLRFNRARVFICDVCKSALRLAPGELRKVCCDARYPYFDKESSDLNIFWVSLHHLSETDFDKALLCAVESLKKGGILVVFEPNTYFLPRHILLKTPLKKHVYVDDAEKPLDFLKVREKVKALGMNALWTRFVQPPYKRDFVKCLKHWRLYYLAVEFLYFIDNKVILPLMEFIANPDSKRYEFLRKFMTSYFLSVYKK